MLERAARTIDPTPHVTGGGPAWQGATTVGWWVERADHPGTDAISVIVEDCRQRWVTPNSPAQERTLADWTAAFHLTFLPPIDALIELHAMVCAGEPLWTDPDNGKDLAADKAANDDAYTYTRTVLDRIEKGWDWRRPDSALAAAVGLATRDDASSFHDRLLIEDPAWREREIHMGRVVRGTAAPGRASGQITVRTSQPMCRFRPGKWVELHLFPPGEDPERYPAEIVDAVYDPNRAQTVLTVRVKRTGNNYARAASLLPGTAAELRPEMPTPGGGIRSRKTMIDRYRLGSWVTGRQRSNRITRREIPIDVAAAAVVD
jgi:hypothetical protein